MALTNALLKSMGIEQDQRDQIMAEHQSTLESIKAERDALQDKAARVPDLERQVQELEAKMPTEDWEAKYGEAVGQLNAHKAQVAEERAEAEKKSLYRAVLREAGVAEKFVDDIVGVTDFSKIEVEDGAIARVDDLKASVADKYATFIQQTTTPPAGVATPQAAAHTATGANPGVQKRLQERHDRLYGKSSKEE